MSVYDDRLETLKAQARQVLDAVVDIGGRESMPAGQAVDRLERVLGYAVAVLDATQGDLLSQPVRDNLTNQLNQFNQWGDDVQARAQGIVANAEPWADAILATVASLPVAKDQDFAQLVIDAAGNYQRAIQEQLNELDVLFDQEQERVAQIKTAADALLNEVKTDAAARLDEVRADADARLAATSEELKEAKASFDARVAEFDQTLTTERAAIDQTKTSQAETFRTAQNERDAAFKAALEDAGHKLELLLAASNDQVDKSVAEIRRMQEESAALVGAIGSAGTAERYGEEVKEQRKVADIWRRVTIVLSVLAAAGVVTVAITLGHNPGWEDFIGKLSASALIGGVAAYAARQSARHREREERARKFQLELTAFGPFIPAAGKALSGRSFAFLASEHLAQWVRSRLLVGADLRIGLAKGLARHNDALLLLLFRRQRLDRLCLCQARRLRRPLSPGGRRARARAAAGVSPRA